MSWFLAFLQMQEMNAQMSQSGQKRTVPGLELLQEQVEHCQST